MGARYEVMDKAILVASRIRSAGSLPARPDVNDACPLHGADSAICALTDFEFDFPITVDIAAHVDDALADMDRLGIHALLVVPPGRCDENPDVVGLVTTYAIERACRMRCNRPPGCHQLGCVRVGDVMTPWEELSLVKYEALRSLTAHDVYEMFQGTGLTHLLVVETHCDTAFVRGVLSRAAVAKRLGRVRRSGSPVLPGRRRTMQDI